jgi:hypothetical protein
MPKTGDEEVARIGRVELGTGKTAGGGPDVHAGGGATPTTVADETDRRREQSRERPVRHHLTYDQSQSP